MVPIEGKKRKRGDEDDEESSEQPKKKPAKKAKSSGKKNENRKKETKKEAKKGKSSKKGKSKVESFMKTMKSKRFRLEGGPSSGESCYYEESSNATCASDAEDVAVALRRAELAEEKAMRERSSDECMDLTGQNEARSTAIPC